MFKKIVFSIAIAGFLFFLFSCSNPPSTDQADPPTELSPVPTPTAEISGIQLTADGDGDYPDLETAIAEVEAGETILLGTGTYRLEDGLEINKSITIIGAGVDESIIISGVGGSVLYFSGDGTYVIEGITIQHEGSSPAHTVLVENGEIDFSNCRFTGATGGESDVTAGLMIRGNSTGTVTNCQVDNNLNTGILVTDESTISLEENICEDNRGVGIAYRKNSSGIARHNTCNENDFAGFYLDTTGELLLETNQCSRNGTEDEMGDGIMVRGSAAPTLDGNTCNENTYAGIAFGGSASGSANNNECSNNGYDGIYLEGEAEPTLEGNTCNRNGTDDLGSGIAYFNSTGGIARENTVRENKREGIFVGNEAAPELIENICNGNKSLGINYLGTQGGSAIKNQCGYNIQIGILVDGNSTPLLEENSCSMNQVGIYIAESANPELVNNELYDNVKEDLYDLRP